MSERDQILFISAHTERGYEKLITVLNQIGHEFPLEAQNRATMGMLIIARDILGKEVDLNPYAKYFAEQPSRMSPDEEQMMERLNNFGQLFVETINSGEKYDIAKLAKQAGIDYEDAKQIAASIERMIRRSQRVRELR